MHWGLSHIFFRVHQHDTWRFVLERPKADQEPMIVNELQRVITLVLERLHGYLSFYYVIVHFRVDIRIRLERFSSPK